MADTQFYNGFSFREFTFNKYRSNDYLTNGGAVRHFFAKLICGRGRLMTEKETLRLEAGDVFYIPYGVRYRSEWFPDENGVIFYSFGFSHLPSNVDYKLQKLDCGENEHFDLLCRELTVNARTVAALYSFFAQVQEQMLPRAESTQDLVSSVAVDLLRKDPSLSAEELARVCGVSVSGLYNIFRRTLGRTPLDVRRELLAERAVELLVTTDLSVEEISSRLGFSSSSYFRKVLRRQTGRTPLAIRGEGIIWSR